jgi:hypothetical protein
MSGTIPVQVRYLTMYSTFFIYVLSRRNPMGFVDIGMYRETGHHNMQKMAKTQSMAFLTPGLLPSSDPIQMPFIILKKKMPSSALSSMTLLTTGLMLSSHPSSVPFSMPSSTLSSQPSSMPLLMPSSAHLNQA